MPAVEIASSCPPQSGNYDVAIGSPRSRRRGTLQRTTHYRLHGPVSSNFYVIKVPAIPVLRILSAASNASDREVALDILPTRTIDVGVRRRASIHRLRRGYKIIEVPVHWYYGRNSRVSPIRDTINMILRGFANPAEWPVGGATLACKNQTPRDHRDIIMDGRRGPYSRRI